MTFLDHLEELRWHVVRAVASIFIMMILAFIYTEEIFKYIVFAPGHVDFITFRWLCKLGDLTGAAGLCVTDIPMKIQSRFLMGSVSQEDYGLYVLYGLPLGGNSTESLIVEMDEEIVKLQTELITEKDLQKLQNKIENEYVNKNATIEGIAESLATYYLLFGDVNLVNTDIESYRTITREEIREVARKYLNPNQRLLLDYVPSKEKSQN